MVKVSKTAFDALLAALFVNNTSGDIEADEVLAQLRNLLDSYPNIDGVAANAILMNTAVDGVATAAAITQTADRLVTTMPVETPPEGLVLGGGQTISAGTRVVNFQAVDGDTAYASGVFWSDGTGTSQPFYIAFEATADTVISDVADTDLTDPQTLAFPAPGTGTFTTRYTVTPVEAGTLRVESYLGSSAIDTNKVVDNSFTIAPGDVGNATELTVPNPQAYRGTDQVFVRLSGVRLRGGLQTSGTFNGQVVPAISARLATTTNVEFTDENIIGQHFVDAIQTQEGISITRDVGTGQLIIRVSTVAPSAALSAFSIAIDPRVDLNTDLNVATNITFTTANTSDISTLTLVNSQGDDITLTVPTNDGTHTQSVTLTGIDTSTAKTIMFSLSGTTTGGDTITSNAQSVEVRTRASDEFAYWYTNTVNDAASVDVTTTTSVDVTPPASTYNILNSLAAGSILLILEPADRPITSIIDTTFNQEAINQFTLTNNIRTINSQSYNLRSLTNNGPSGTVSFRVTHG